MAVFAFGAGQQSTAGAAANEVQTVSAFSAFTPPPTIQGVNTYGDHLAWQVIEKKLNVKIDFKTVPGNDWATQLGLVMASGSLPDFFLRINPQLAEQYGRQGALMPLNDLINTKIPNLKKIMNDYKAVTGAMTSADGKIFFVPRLLLDLRLRHYCGLMIREDWLQSLGLKMPSTTDDFYNVLKAIKGADFNKNGNTNEAPFVGDYRFLIWAFGVGSRGMNQNNDFFVENGELKYGPTDPRYRTAIEYLNKLYSDGLIENASGDTYMQKLIGESAGCTFGSWTGVLTTYNRMLESAKKNPGLRGVIPLMGPTGERNNLGHHTEIDLDCAGAISSATKKADTIARIFDYLYSSEGSVVMAFGLEGDTFTYVNGEPTWTAKVLNSNLSSQNYRAAYISDASTIPHNYNVLGYIANLSPAGIEANKMTADNNKNDKKPPSLRFSEAEIKEVQALQRDLDTFVDENVDKFIKGQQPFSQWNTFQQGLQQLKVARLVELYNASYKRFVSVSR
ncbi:MAG: extracellular solute-binding protein [Treponema sp.]|nr:extracellular solute-binding protein [Treponema sp.]